MNALGIYMLVSLFFVMASFIEFGMLLILKRVNLIEGRKNIVANNTDEAIQKHATSSLATMFHRPSNKRNDILFDERGARNIKENRYSVIDKVDFGSFVCFLFSYILFNFLYIILYAN